MLDATSFFHSNLFVESQGKRLYSYSYTSNSHPLLKKTLDESHKTEILEQSPKK